VGSAAFGWARQNSAGAVVSGEP